MNIGLDGHIFCLNNPTGIPSYVKNIIEHMRLDSPLDFYYMMPEKESKFGKFPENSKINTHIVKLSDPLFKHKNTPASINFLQNPLYTHRVISENNINTYVQTNFTSPLHLNQRSIVMIYDLIPFKYKYEINGKLRNIVRNYFTTNAVYNSDVILTISKSVANEIIEYFDLKTPEKVKYIYPAVSHIQQLDDDEKIGQKKYLEEKYKIKLNKIILTNYAITPRKNIISIVKAYNMLPANIKKQYTLFIVGPEIPYFFDTYKEILHEKHKCTDGNIILTGYVSLDELIKIYNVANTFVSATLAEGFDMPVIQAFSLGMQVIASDIPVHHETLQNLVLYFNPNDVLDLKEKLYSVLYYNSFRTPELYFFKSRYNWDIAAEQFKNILLDK